MKKIIIILLVFVLIMIGAAVLYGKLSTEYAPDQLTGQEEAPEEEEIPVEEETVAEEEAAVEEEPPKGSPAVDFIVYDEDGNQVHLFDYIGKPLVLNFWASWCGPCKMEMPFFQEKYEELGEDVQFLMVNMTSGSRETKERAVKLIQKSEYTFPVLYDLDSYAAYVYSVYSLPTTLFLDAEGYVIAMANGSIKGEILQRGIDMIFPREHTENMTGGVENE